MTDRVDPPAAAPADDARSKRGRMTRREWETLKVQDFERLEQENRSLRDRARRAEAALGEMRGAVLRHAWHTVECRSLAVASERPIEIDRLRESCDCGLRETLAAIYDEIKSDMPTLRGAGRESKTPEELP